MEAEKYHTSESEHARISDVLRLLPTGARSVLEIGSRDGRITRLLAERFPEVVALDLEKPDFDIPRVVPVRGDVTRLDFPDDHFDCVVCTEVLEHVSAVEQAANELSRVTRGSVLIGVPYRQDIRIGRTTCARCGAVNPPWGHVNAFDEGSLCRLFPGLTPGETSFVWQTRGRTNALSTWLADLAGNPWGTYDQGEPCVRCGARLERPAPLTLRQKALIAAAIGLVQIQSMTDRPRPSWIHMVFTKPSFADMTAGRNGRPSGMAVTTSNP